MRQQHLHSLLFRHQYNNNHRFSSAISITVSRSLPLHQGGCYRHFSTETKMKTKTIKINNTRMLPDDGLDLSHFLTSSSSSSSSSSSMNEEYKKENYDHDPGPAPLPFPLQTQNNDDYGPALSIMPASIPTTIPTEKKTLKFHLKTYGCQMNVSDSDVVRSILLGHNNSDNDNNINDGNDSSSISDPRRRGVVKRNKSTRISNDIKGNNNNNINTNINNTVNNRNKHNIHLRFEETSNEDDADVLLTNTCAIRENAEEKVRHRLRELKGRERNKKIKDLRKIQSFAVRNNDINNGKNWNNDGINNINNNDTNNNKSSSGYQTKSNRIVGLLGCMAKREVDQAFEKGAVDLVAGPDAYRDLPGLVSRVIAHNNNNNINSKNSTEIDNGDDVIDPFGRAASVQLSLDETYENIRPVRRRTTTTDDAIIYDPSAFVAVTRGCNNMCSYW